MSETDALKWTNTRPTADGDYGCCSDRGKLPEFREVIVSTAGMVMWGNGNGTWSVIPKTVFFFGPIPPIRDLKTQPAKISGLDLSIRASNALESEGVETVSDLVGMSPTDLLCLKNFGRTSLKEVRRGLEQFGLHLNGDKA